jgi:RHS repeat-associated protein
MAGKGASYDRIRAIVTGASDAELESGDEAVLRSILGEVTDAEAYAVLEDFFDVEPLTLAIYDPSDADAYRGRDVRQTSAEETQWLGSLISQTVDAGGLMYMRNRYYDPKAGRFTQEDPIGLAGGMNLYGFANGDPVNFSDPFGLCPDLCFVEGAAAAGAGVYIAGVAVAATIGAILAGDRIGDAFTAGADAARAKVGSIAAWARNKQQASHIKGKLGNIEAHFDKLAGAGGPDDGDPNDPRNREKWKSDIRRAISQIREHIDKITGDRNKAPFQEAVKQAEKRLGGTP